MDISKLKNVVQAAENTKRKEAEAIRSLIGEQELLGQNEFWEELDRFLKIIKGFGGFGQADWSEHAADEFFRSAICEVNGTIYTWGQSSLARDQPAHNAGFEAMVKCLRFVVTYENMVAKIHKALERLEGNGVHQFCMGDDSFHDMCDSYPLHGRATYKALMDDVVPDEPSLGENYVAMRLRNASDKWVHYCVLNLI